MHKCIDLILKKLEKVIMIQFQFVNILKTNYSMEFFRKQSS